MSDTTILPIQKGTTFTAAVRWEAETFTYKAITGISQTAPVVITVPGHGLPGYWRVAITNVKGMTEINATANALKDKDFHLAKVIDPNTIEINSINAAGFKPYISGGHIQYGEPIDLTNFTKARMSFNTKPDGSGTELFSLTTENGRISINTATRIINLNISAADTGFTWNSAFFDLELVSNDVVPEVIRILEGVVTVSKEVTK